MKYSLLIISLLLPIKALAGWLSSAHMAANSFSFLSIDGENTPNYYGFGPDITLGYSIKQKFDISARLNYIPGTSFRPKVGSEEAQLLIWGLQLAMRIESKIFFNLLLGKARYNLVKAKEVTGEIPGRWSGLAASLGLGTIFRVSKSVYWQFGLAFSHSRLTPELDTQRKYASEGPRQIDVASLYLGITYNSFGGFRRSVLRNLF